MTMTPKQCRLAAAAMEAGEPMDITKAIELLRSHADALEEIERLKGERDVAVGMMNVALDQREQAERRAERLKVLADKMAHGKGTIAINAMIAYRADYPKE